MSKHDGPWQCPHCGRRTIFNHLGMRYKTREEIDEDIKKILDSETWTPGFIPRTCSRASSFVSRLLARLKKAMRIAA